MRRARWDVAALVAVLAWLVWRTTPPAMPAYA